MNDLCLERAFLEAEITRIETDVGATRGILEGLETRAETFQARRLEEIRMRLAHARSRLAVLKARGLSDPEEPRLIDAVDPDQARLPAEPILHELALDHARERVSVLEIALAELDARLVEARVRLAAVERRIAREEVHINARRGREITSPVTGFPFPGELATSAIDVALVAGMGLSLAFLIDRTRTPDRAAVFFVAFLLAGRYAWWRATETLAPAGWTIDMAAS